MTAKPSKHQSPDDIRRKYREALERKQQHKDPSADTASNDGSSKSHGATGPTQARIFRRKSG